MLFPRGVIAHRRGRVDPVTLHFESGLHPRGLTSKCRPQRSGTVARSEGADHTGRPDSEADMHAKARLLIFIRGPCGVPYRDCLTPRTGLSRHTGPATQTRAPPITDSRTFTQPWTDSRQQPTRRPRTPAPAAVDTSGPGRSTPDFSQTLPHPNRQVIVLVQMHRSKQALVGVKPAHLPNRPPTPEYRSATIATFGRSTKLSQSSNWGTNPVFHIPGIPHRIRHQATRWTVIRRPPKKQTEAPTSYLLLAAPSTPRLRPGAA